jgi:hypothetical protein
VLFYFHLLPGPWFENGWALSFVIPGMLGLYAGIRRFAGIAGLKGWMMSWKYLLAAMVVAPLLSLLMPHYEAAVTPWYQFQLFDATLGLVISVFMTAALFALLRSISPAYSAAFKGLAAGGVMQVLGFVSLYYFAFVGPDPVFVKSGLISMPFTVTGLFFAWSGYQFCRIQYYKTKPRDLTGRPLIDAVIDAAHLVSNRNDIDGFLQQVRFITARLQPEAALGEKDKQEFIQIYLKLEDYLINHEKLKAFTRGELRGRLSPEVLALLPAKV